LDFWVTSPARAHYVWIEPDQSQHAGLYFDEYQGQLREVLHTEKQRGEFIGQPFESVRHWGTLGFTVKAGADER
jgi:hypothetical protein